MHYRHYRKYIGFSCLILALNGCSYFYGEEGLVKNRDHEYIQAKSIPPLMIPPGYSSSTMQAHYPVSDRDYPTSRKPIDLTPPELNSASK